MAGVPATGARGDGEQGFEMGKIRNIHGQGRYIQGDATGETFVDFGEIGDDRYVRVRVRSSEDGHTIEVNIDGEMCAAFNDAPAMEIRINGELILDTSEQDVAQPRRDLPPRD